MECANAQRTNRCGGETSIRPHHCNVSRNARNDAVEPTPRTPRCRNGLQIGSRTPRADKFS
eukprot:1672731-Lingulodinium_polyedra.AAC.1